MRLDVNMDGAIQLTARMERLNRSAFPLAVRSTLNDLAFDMKQKELGNSFKKNFKPKAGSLSYYKKLNRVEKAAGYNVNSMQSKVGLLSTNRNDQNFISGMEKQEFGGNIKKGLRYLKDARGGSLRKRVSEDNYYKKSKMVKGPFRRAGTKKSKFVASAIVSMRENKMMFLKTSKGKMLVKVNSISSSILDKKIKFDFNFIAMSRKKKQTNLRARGNVKEAQEKTIVKVTRFYQKNADYQFNRALRR